MSTKYSLSEQILTGEKRERAGREKDKAKRALFLKIEKVYAKSKVLQSLGSKFIFFK